MSELRCAICARQVLELIEDDGWPFTTAQIEGMSGWKLRDEGWLCTFCADTDDISVPPREGADKKGD